MIYLIGGPPRVGKSILAQEFINNKPIYSFSTDFLYDIDQVRDIENFDKLGIIQKGEAFFPILERLIGNIERQSENCLIDGDVILPGHVKKLSEKYQIRACFLGLSETSLEDIIRYGGHFNWPEYKIKNGMGDNVSDLAQRTILSSKIIESECEIHNQKYYDMATNFKASKQMALNFLTQSSE